MAVVLFIIGVELFTRRDRGVTAGLSVPGLPAAALGVRGPDGVAAGTAMLGSASLGLYADVAVGVGIAAGALWRTSLAAEVAAVLVTATFLLDLLAPPLRLPDWVHQLALTAHMGAPMIGTWDVSGVVACLVIAAGGSRSAPGG